MGKVNWFIYIYMFTKLYIDILQIIFIFILPLMHKNRILGD